MFFYQIKLRSVPRIKFACSLSTDRYKNIIDRRPNLLELSVHSGVGIQYSAPGRSFILPSESMALLTPDMSYHTVAAEKGMLHINTVSVELDDWEFRRRPAGQLSPALFEDPETLLLPDTFPLGSAYLQIVRRIKTLINHYLNTDSVSHFHCVSDWFELVSTVSGLWYASLYPQAQSKKASDYYVRKAEAYIHQHCFEKLPIPQIAAELKITPNYLCDVFKRGTGRTIVEYVNMLRVQRARELLYQGKLSVAEITESVGLSNPRYLRELFKRFLGLNLQQCRRIDHEISLYHQKPWEVPDLQYDIFDAAKKI